MHGGKVMPWTRWKKGEVQNAKLEHQELAEWKKSSFTNKAFEEYYIRNGVVTEREWPRLLDVLRRPLPTTFRLHASHPSAAGLRARLLRGDFNVPVPQPRDAARRQPSMGAAPARDVTVRTVPGLPASAQAWQLGFDRAAFRSHAARVPVIGELFAELRDAMSCGAAVRQEVASMLPRLLLRPQPGERALDTCAAPGSKTAQLLEAVRPWPAAAAEADPAEADEGGLVVANDIDRAERVPALAERFSRWPAHERAGWVLCSGRAELLPRPRFAPTPARPGSSPVDGYDLVLTDVPCSGDGTVRKSVDILRRWTPQPALELHATQLAILRRGLELLRTGGRLCYSTCSLNPVEDEAVVAAALGAVPRSSVRLLDAHAALQAAGSSLRLRRGLASWQVADPQFGAAKKLRWHRTVRDARAAGMEPALPSMWPPRQHDAEISAQLERCARVVQHDNNTGGFFLAMFEKVGDIPSHHRCQVPTVDRSVSHRPADFVPSVVESGAAAATQQHGRQQLWVSVDGARRSIAPIDMPLWSKAELRNAGVVVVGLPQSGGRERTG